MRDLFFFDAVETAYDIPHVEGELPPWVRGSYYINGPARFERGGRRYRHWLDGDGMVCALHFTDRGVRFVSRFVDTRKSREESAAGEFLYRGFGTAFPGDRLLRNVMLESPVNINACLWENRLLAFGEQSLPVELDAQTLETIGDFDFGGAINEVTPLSAHAKVDHHSGAMLNFGISHSASQPMLHIYEFPIDGSDHQRRRFPLALQHSNHDFHFTENHAVFFLSPYIMNFERFLADGVSVLDALEWKPDRGSRIMVVPRTPAGGKAFEVDAGCGYCLHLINAFEADGSLFIDVLELDRPVYSDYQTLPDLFVDAPHCSPVRYVIDLETQSLADRQAMRYNLCCDFPAVDARLQSKPYNDFWLLGISSTGQPGTKFFDQLARGSWAAGNVVDAFATPPGEFFGGEPVLIPNDASPKESLVMVQHLNRNTGEDAFVLFRAYAIHEGPVIRIPLRDPIHPLFHAAYYPAG